jgi:hypothetical protein
MVKKLFSHLPSLFAQTVAMAMLFTNAFAK